MAARPLNGNSRSDEASTSTLVEELNEAEDVNPESFFVRALYDFTASDNSSLSFRKDDIIEVLTQLPSGWWDGLLGEARGWFPSNYVEQIDDKEVYGSGVEEDAAGQMMDLQAEEDEEVDLAPFDEAGHAASTGLESALSLSTSTYPTDGNFTVGEKAVADFDALRKLMSTDGTGEVSSPGNNNAFQNLAEAAMLDQSGSSQRREGEERGKRSSLAMGGPDPRNADIELGSIFSKSTNPSLRDPSSSSIKSPIENSAIRERPHMKIGDQTAALGAGPSRPRAATGLPDSPTISYQLRERAASTGTPDERRNLGSKEDGDWVPRLTEGGEYVYYNVQTGAQVSDLSEVQNSLPSEEPSPMPASPADSLYSPAGAHPRVVKGGDYFTRLKQGGGPGLLSTSYDNGPSGGIGLQNVPPPSMLREYKEAEELQKLLLPAHPTSLQTMLRQANDKLGHLIEICQEKVGSDGLSEVDLKLGAQQPHLLDKSGIRLGAASSLVVHAFRDFLYSAGILNISSTDLATIAELASLVPLSPEKGNTGAVAAFAGAVVAMQSQLYQAQQDGSSPAVVRTIGSRLTQLLSKLVLSVRSVTENPQLSRYADVSSPMAASEEEDAIQRHAEKLRAYRHRVAEDAQEIGQLLQTLSDELRRQTDGSRMGEGELPPWAKRLEGAIKSNNGMSGVSIDPVNGGGSASGWRGSGFALPTAQELAALRFQPKLSAQDRRNLSSQAQTLLHEGQEKLKRRPGLSLTERFLHDRLDPQLEALVSQIQEIVVLLRGPSAEDDEDEDSEDEETLEQSNPDSPTTAPEEFDTGDYRNGNGQSPRSARPPARALDLSTAKKVMRMIKQLNLRLGTFIALVEDIDVASVLDVDGPPSPSRRQGDNNDSSSPRMQYLILVSAARRCLGAFLNLKQGCYDISSELLMDTQEISRVLCGFTIDPTTPDRLLKSLRGLKLRSQGMIRTAHQMARLAIEQRESHIGHHYIGARSRVYGVEDAMSASADLFRPSSVSTPSGESSSASLSQTASSSLATSQSRSVSRGLPTGVTNKAGPLPRLTTNLNSSGGYSRNRDRSASVTTGGSTGTSASGGGDPAMSRVAGSRRGTDLDSSVEDDGVKPPVTARSGGSSKLRKIFGEDATNAASSSSPALPLSASQSSAVPSGVKQEEERPWFLDYDYSPDDIVFTDDGKTVKGGTLHALVVRLTLYDGFNLSYNNTFLMTYRSFTTTGELLDLLFDRCGIAPPLGLTDEEMEIWVTQKQFPIRIRVFAVLKSWLETFFYEGEDDEHLDRIQEFAITMQYQVAKMEGLAKQLLRLVDRRRGKEEQQVMKMNLSTPAPPPILPKSRKIKFLDIDPIEMARQLTLLDSNLYNKIKPVECLNKAWSKPDSDIHAKGIKDTISTSNRITGWVAEAILVQDDLKKRAAWIKQFIAIADACRQLNNFSTMTAIVSGLNSAPVYRLKRSWDVVNQRYVAMLENLNRIMQSSKNFADYREMIHSLVPPCVPFLGVYLTDLTFIEDGNPDRLTKGNGRLINFGKRQKAAEVIREILIYQSTPYNLQSVAGIQRFIEDNLVESRSDTDLYAQSIALEPREKEDERVARLLSESGFL